MGIADEADDCVYIDKKCTATLSGDARIADIYFVDASADLLFMNTADTAFTGTV